MNRRAVVAAGVLILLFGPSGQARASAAGAMNCSAEQGQLYIAAGEYEHAVREFTCLIKAQPGEVEGYRGRIEALLMLGEFSDAFRDYARVTAFVLPGDPDAVTTILDGYSSRLAENPDEVPALTGLSFALWWRFSYAGAINVLDDLLALEPDDVYGNLLRGSSVTLKGGTPTRAAADIEHAIALAPDSPDVHYIVADAYLYGRGDYARASAEATTALAGGLDTPRVHAIPSMTKYRGRTLADLGHAALEADPRPRDAARSPPPASASAGTPGWQARCDLAYLSGGIMPVEVSR